MLRVRESEQEHDRIGETERAQLRINKQMTTTIQSNPIQSNPIQSNPIQSNPIFNPISNLQSNQTTSLTMELSR